MNEVSVGIGETGPIMWQDWMAAGEWLDIHMPNPPTNDADYQHTYRWRLGHGNVIIFRIESDAAMFLLRWGK